MHESVPRSRWQAFRFAVKMIEIRLRFIAVFVAIGLAIGYWETLRNYWDKWTRPQSTAAAVAADEEYFCPMDPQVIRDSLDPGGKLPMCPICNMPLSKRKKGAPVELPPGVLSRAQFSPERVQYAGLRTVEVAFQPLQQEVRAVGYVQYDESRLSQIVSRFTGYVERLHVDKTFQTVAAGDPLAEIYSPELYNAVHELRMAQERRDERMVGLSREKLLLLGVGDREIEEILHHGKADARLVIRSPRSGFVISKSVIDGSRIEMGQTLFEIADLSGVWIEADVFEKDIAFLRAGQEITATVEAYPGRVFTGRTALVHPMVQGQTRTNRVRFELENPNLELRPGMYATIRIHTPVAELEPFRTQIAQRRQRPSAQDFPALVAWQQICPVTGLPLGSMGEPVPTTVGEYTWMLCCEGCEGRLQESPGKYLARLALPPEDSVLVVPHDAVIDTGARKIVYVEREPGMFDGIEVVLGPRSDRFYPVLSGLSPGDRVATAGSFLIDAETRLNPAASATYFGATGGADSRPSAVQSQHTHGSSPPTGQPAAAHLFTPEELQELNQLPAAEREQALAQKVCPVTGLNLGSMGQPVKVTVAGQTVFLCCAACEPKLRREPERYLRKLRPDRPE